jgi:hypothetical protein
MGIAIAQAGLLPVPSGIFAKGSIAVAPDDNNLVGLPSVAARQVLISTSVGTVPSFSVPPALRLAPSAPV